MLRVPALGTARLAKVGRTRQKGARPIGRVGTSILNPKSALTETLAKVARYLSRRPAVLRISRLLPGPLRMLVRRRVKDLSRNSALYDLPVRLDLPKATRGPGPQFRVIVFGTFYSDWNAALVEPAVWQAIPGVVEVHRLLHAEQVAELPPTSAHTVIIPFGGRITSATVRPGCARSCRMPTRSQR